MAYELELMIPTSSVESAEFVFRGLSPAEAKAVAHGSLMSPLSPVDTPGDWLGILGGAKEADDHVLGNDRTRFLSFSFQPRVAAFYALSEHGSPYCRQGGWVAIVRLPEPLRSLDNRVFLAMDGSSSWIDPRSLLRARMRNRARVDDEFLLARGALTARVVRMTRGQLTVASKDRLFWPIQYWGEQDLEGG